jgi:hypothetical protein
MNSDECQNMHECVSARANDNSELMTESDLIQFLRIPEISKSKDYHNVIENLKRMHDLPRVHICGKPLYPIEAIRHWIKEKTVNGK